MRLPPIRIFAWLVGCAVASGLVLSLAISPTAGAQDGSKSPEAVKACFGHLALVTSDTSSMITKLSGIYRELTGADDAAIRSEVASAKAAAVANLKSGRWSTSTVESGVWDCYHSFGTDVPSGMVDKIIVAVGLDEPEPEPPARNYVSADGNSIQYHSADDPTIGNSTTSLSGSGGSGVRSCAHAVQRYDAITDHFNTKVTTSNIPVTQMQDADRDSMAIWSVVDELKESGCFDGDNRVFAYDAIDDMCKYAMNIRDAYFSDQPLSCHLSPPH